MFSLFSFPQNIWISSPLLHTKSLQNLAATNDSLLYPSFCRSGIQKSSACPLAQTRSQGCGCLETSTFTPWLPSGPSSCLAVGPRHRFLAMGAPHIGQLPTWWLALSTGRAERKERDLERARERNKKWQVKSQSLCHT